MFIDSLFKRIDKQPFSSDKRKALFDLAIAAIIEISYVADTENTDSLQNSVDNAATNIERDTTHPTVTIFRILKTDPRNLVLRRFMNLNKILDSSIDLQELRHEIEMKEIPDLRKAVIDFLKEISPFKDSRINQ